jgi:hypothetical protein
MPSKLPAKSSAKRERGLPITTSHGDEHGASDERQGIRSLAKYGLLGPDVAGSRDE